MKEYTDVKHDNCVLRALTGHEDKTKSGIVLAQPGNYDHLKTEALQREAERENAQDISMGKRTNRYQVVAVGPGLWVDAASDEDGHIFLRRPMCCRPGDVVIVEAGPKPFPVDGEILFCAKDHMILARVATNPFGDEEIEPTNDYIFSSESAHIMQSTGGIIMPGAQDPTGNVRLPIRFRAKEVSSGPWVVRWLEGKPAFARRPMAVVPGEEFAFDGRGFEVHVGGKTRIVTQDWMTALVFRPFNATAAGQAA